jgi:hypothetical protein
VTAPPASLLATRCGMLTLLLLCAVEHWGVPDRFALLAQTGLLDRLAR